MSYCARAEVASWELKEVDAWPLRGFETNKVAGPELAHVYLVEEKDGVQIIATRRVARGHGGILTEIPIAVLRWGKAESWEYCTRTEGEEGRTPTVAIQVERSGPEDVTTAAGTFSCLRFKLGPNQFWLARGIGLVKKVIDRPDHEPEVWELSSYRTLIRE